MKNQAYAYNGVLGGKTGYTEAAGNTLVTYAKNDNTYLVSVVLQSVNGAYSDTRLFWIMVLIIFPELR